MEQQSRRERKKEETKRKILDTAFRLFVEQGFDHTTVDRITEEADVGKGTFYNYFPTKEAALVEFMENLSRQRSEKIRHQVLGCQDIRERLAVTFKSVTSWFEEYPELVNAYLRDRVHGYFLNPAGYKPSHFEQFITEILRIGQESGDLRDDIEVSQLVNYLMFIFFSRVCAWFEGGAKPGLYKMAMDGVDFFLIGALSTER